MVIKIDALRLADESHRGLVGDQRHFAREFHRFILYEGHFTVDEPATPTQVEELI